MSRFAIRDVPFSLPSPFLEGANWGDRFEVLTTRAFASPKDAVDILFSRKPPFWVRALNTTRNKVVGLIGLKNGEISVDQEKAGGFPITHQSDEAVVFGFDDWHLDFRVVVETRPVDGGTLVAVSTLVQRKHWFGYLYIFTITPFHKLIVQNILKQVAVDGAAARA